MTIFVGEDIEIRVQAVRPLTHRYIADATVVAEFFAPNKDPINVPGDRTSPASTLPLSYVATERAYVGVAETVGWAAGKWTVRALLGGGDSIAFYTFVLAA